MSMVPCLETLVDFHGHDKQEWGMVQFSVAKYVGNTIRLGFGVTNDGSGQRHRHAGR